MMFLKVPFAEKEEAKALGARWNGERKSWYVPDGRPVEAFERWLPPGGADFVPAVAKPSLKSRPVTTDSYIGKSVIGRLYIELQHDCNPFDVCPVCAPKLAVSGWQAHYDDVLKMLTPLRP
jgi:hypothetical protein